MKKNFVFVLLCSLSFFLQIESKTISDYEYLSKFDRKSWSYLTKFATGPGQGRLHAKGQFHKVIHTTKTHVSVNILAYRDEDWYKARNIASCKDKVALAKINVPLQLPTDGSWSQEIFETLEQKENQVWFIVLADCDKNVSPFAIGNRIRWEVQLFNSDGSHFSEDENGMLTTFILVFIIIAGFFVMNSIKFYKFYNTEEGIDYPTLITTIALFIEFLSLLCEILHLWIYSYNGKGNAFFNFSNHILSITSQFLITCLLLLMAHGWSINFLEFEDMDVFIPLGILLGIMHIVIVGVGKIMDNEHYKYHDYENWAGVVVIVIRLLLYVFWVYLFTQTYNTAKRTEKSFYKTFGIFASIYFLIFPVLVIFSTFFVAPYAKHKVVTTGTLLLQTITLLLFTLIFTTKKTQYYQISLKGKTLLPTNKLA